MHSSVRVHRWQITPRRRRGSCYSREDWGCRENGREEITTPQWTVTDYNNMATLSILQASRSDKFEAVHLHGTCGTKHSTRRVITFSMSPSWLSPPSLGRLFLPLPLSLASMEPHRSAGDTGRWHGPSDVLAGALMMRRLLVYMMILPKSNTEDWRTQIMFFLKFHFSWVDNLMQ